MHKRLIVGCLIFAAGIAIGYKAGEDNAIKDYAEWQKSHKFSCWRARKNPERPGDYPPVFVIETTKVEAQK